METVFPDGCGLSQQVNVLCHKAKMVQEWFEEHNNECEVLTWPPNFPDLNPIHLWDVLDKQVWFMEAIEYLLLTSWCQISQHTFRGLVESMTRWVKAVLAANEDPHNIRQVVIILSLTGVNLVVVFLSTSATTVKWHASVPQSYNDPNHASLSKATLLWTNICSLLFFPQLYWVYNAKFLILILGPRLFIKTFNSIADKHAPFKKFKFKNRNNPWFQSETGAILHERCSVMCPCFTQLALIGRY